jgi:hypothetical protein
MSDTISPLAKQKLILALLAQSPKHSRKHDQLRDCLFYIPHYVCRLPAMTRQPETSQIRCGLKYRCPKCMDPINVVAARRKDFLTILKAVRKLGGGEHAENVKVWLLSGVFDKRFRGYKLAQLLSRKDSRHTPAILGRWGAEAVCAVFRAIINSNSPKPRAAFVFNSLVFGSPETELDVERLQKLGFEVFPYHRKLGTAWQLYLEWWATAQVGNQDPEAIVEWMSSRGRTFEALGALRGVKARERTEHLDALHASVGSSTRLGFWSRLEQAAEVLKRIEHDLPLNASNLLNRVLTREERLSIMAKVKSQVEQVLTPEMTLADLALDRPMTDLELRGRLDEIAEQNRKLLKLLQGEDDRVVKPPDKIM